MKNTKKPALYSVGDVETDEIAEEEAEREAGARIAEAKALAEQERTEAHRKAETFRQEKQLSAEKEILHLREKAAAWEEEAIRAMIRFLGG